MESLVKVGKNQYRRLREELKPMISPDRNHNQVQWQNQQSSIPQPYAPAPGFTPTSGLSPYFQQQVVQTSPSPNFYAQSGQYQSPSTQPQAPAGSYFNTQSPQPHSLPQLQATQSSQYPPAASPHPQYTQQAPVQQASQYPQQYQSPPPQQFYPTPPPRTPQPLGQQDLQSQQQQQCGSQYSYSNSVSTPATSSPALAQPQYVNYYPQAQPSPFPFVSSPAPSQRPQDSQYTPAHPVSTQSSIIPTPPESQPTWSPPPENVKQPSLVPATASGAPTTSAIELPAEDAPVRPATQPYLMDQQSRNNSMNTTTPIAHPYSAPPQAYQDSNYGTVQSHQVSPAPLSSIPTNAPSPFVTVQQHMATTASAAQGDTHSHVSSPTLVTAYGHQDQAHQPPIAGSQDPSMTQYFPPPPRTPIPAATPISSPPPPPPPPPQRFSTASSAPLKPQLQLAPSQPQLQLVNQYQSQPGPQLYQPTPSIPSFGPITSPPPATPSQPSNQPLGLEQEFKALTVASGPPGLSSSFKEITKPNATPKPPKKTRKGGPAPSVLRVQTEGHASTLRKILCLDGGGVRGLASLMIVKDLMRRLEIQRGGRFEPWQEFDMICGTSTGGLIALMLGRLRMPVADCIDAYKTLSKRIFTPVHSKANVAGRAIVKWKAEGKFESEPLEQVMKEMCQKCGLEENELLKENSSDAPKVFVCAAQGYNADAVVIRSYQSREWDDLYDICKIWEAARATSAANTFFPPICIGDQEYVDGALRYNNPIEKADQESRERLIVSVGTGSAPGPNVLPSNIIDLAKTLAKIVTDSELENVDFRKRNPDMIENNLLFRFNVLQGLSDVELNEWEAVGKISAHTSTYLKHPDTANSFEKCANKMKESGQRLGYIAGEEVRVFQEIQEMSEDYCEFCEDCRKGIPYLERMFLCVDCQLFTCEECHDSHERSHLRNMLRFSIIKWMEKLPIELSAPCRHCAKESKVRWQCEDCGWALCRNCVGWHDRRIEFFTEHRKHDPDGRSFIATYPPYWSTTSAWYNGECRCLDLGKDGAAHCERCHKVVTYGERGYFCRSCRGQFGTSQDICLQCFEEEEEEHRETHQFGTFEVVYEESGPETVDDALKKLWGCAQCPERFAQGKQHTHIHLHLKLIITPFFAEILRRSAYQTCYRKELQESSKQHPNPTPFQCVLCFKYLAFDQVGSLCLREGCTDCFCASCTLSQRAGHRHHLYEFTIMRCVQSFNQIACNYCSQVYMVAMAQGLWCPDCQKHFMCISCIVNIGKTGNPHVEDGLPHMKYLKQCKVKKNWQLYIMQGHSD